MMTDDENTPGGRGGKVSVFGRNVRALREAIGLSANDLIVQSGVSNIKMIESGKRKQPRIPQQKKIARALRVPVWRLHVDRSDESATPEPLKEFRASPLGKSIRPDELDYLLALPSMLGRRLTFDGYYKALEMLRASSPDDSIAYDDDDESDG